ncbi:MAG: hypothetical protein II213_04800 [Lachnospiraceae bacterium]|nr:hypothetical protein [Lachnospiraceae bacterium]
MDKKDLLFYFLSSAKNMGKRIKVTGGEPGVVKGNVTELIKENDKITVVVNDVTYVINLSDALVRTGAFDPRTLFVDGEDSLKFQLC